MKTILVPIDFSEVTERVLAAARIMARPLGAKIVLAHVANPPQLMTECGPMVENLRVAADNAIVDQLSRRQTELEGDGLPVETSRLFGQPAACIREKAERLGADYIVLGSHGHGAVYDLVIGSTARELLRHSPCPILIVPVRSRKG